MSGLRATQALKDTLRLLVGMLIGTGIGLAISVPPCALVVAGYPGWAGVYLTTLILAVLYGMMYLGHR
jgi:hypothetical protein